MSVRLAPRWGIVVSVAALALAGCATTTPATSSEPTESMMQEESASMEPTRGATEDDAAMGDVVHIVDADGSLWSNFGVPSQPAFALINDNGEITTIQGSLGLNGILDAANSLLES